MIESFGGGSTSPGSKKGKGLLKAAVTRGNDTSLEIEESMIDDSGPGEILVKAAASGICHSELTAIERRLPVPPPSPVKIREDMPLDRTVPTACGMTTGLARTLNTVRVRAGASIVTVGRGGASPAALQGARIVGAGKIIAAARTSS